MMRRPPPPAPRRQAPPPAQRCVEINQCVGCHPGSVERRGTHTATPSSRRRIDGVEVDATIQNAP